MQRVVWKLGSTSDTELQDFGTQWLSSLRRAISRVPAAVVPVEANCLLNPRHPRHSEIGIVRERRDVSAYPFRWGDKPYLGELRMFRDDSSDPFVSNNGRDTLRQPK